jgi:Cu(I)-responsive transcriptional regulator
MNIGDAAQAAGVTAKMIRHYEELGLIPQAARTEAGYRQYGPREIAVLQFIRQARTLGFSMKHIAQLLGLWADATRESREVKALATQHIAELDRKMAEMAQMKAALASLAGGCHGDERSDCPILATLGGKEATALPAPELKPKRRPVTARRTAPRPVERADHSALVAWMQGVQRVPVAEHA